MGRLRKSVQHPRALRGDRYLARDGGGVAAGLDEVGDLQEVENQWIGVDEPRRVVAHGLGVDGPREGPIPGELRGVVALAFLEAEDHRALGRHQPPLSPLLEHVITGWLPYSGCEAEIASIAAMMLEVTRDRARVDVEGCMEGRPLDPQSAHRELDRQR